MSGYQTIGVLKSIDPHTKISRGMIEVGTDEKGDVHLRTVRNQTDIITRFRPEMAFRVAELMSRAACASSAHPSEAKQAARKMTAEHLMLARAVLDKVRGKDLTEGDATRIIAAALTTELRRGVALAQHAAPDSELLEALTIGDEPEATEPGNGLGLA